MRSAAGIGRALEIFDEVADLPEASRHSRLDELCAGDAALRARIEAMLAADARSGDLFEGNAAVRWSDALQVATGGDALLGSTIGVWKIVAVAGRGGMGIVYEVQRADGAYTQRAALKLIHAAAQSPLSYERFLRERQILAQLRHPNIATLLDGGLTPAGDPWFVMEYVDGVPIDAWCDERRLGVRARVELFVQVLDAVSHAHRNLLVHRDLKPSNLLVDATGRIKLLDFGIAKQLQEHDATALDDRAVTFGYASPEQLNNEAITTATDIWQLGIVLHLLLSGAHPFRITRDTPLAKQIQQLDDQPQSLMAAAADATPGQAAARGTDDPAALAKALRGGLAEIVATCLRRAQSARYASVDALATDLQYWLQDRPVVAKRAGPRERTALWLRRNRVLAASLAAVATALVVGTAVSLWQAREAQRESARTRESLQFLADTLTAAAPEQTLNREVSVRQLLDSARHQLDQRSSVDAQVRQPVQRMLGRLYFSVGDPQLATELLEAGMRGIEPDNRAAALALADDLVVYSDALANLERNADSLAASERSAALRQKFAPDDPEQQLRALAHQTVGHVQKYGWEICRQRAERALAIANRMANPPVDVVLRLYSDLGSVANFTNDRNRLSQVSEEGLAFAVSHAVPPQSPLIATLLRNRIEGLLLLDRPAEAEAQARAVIAMTEKSGGFAATRLSVLYNALAKALGAQGRFRESLAALMHTNELLLTDGSGPRNLAAVRVNLATTYAQIGDYAQSLQLMEQSIAALDQARVAAADTFRLHYEEGYARVLLANGRTAQARQRLDATLELVRKTLGVHSEDYARLLVDEAEAALQDGDAARGQRLVAEARERAIERGMTPASRQAAELLHYDSAFALLRGDLLTAEARQREALQSLQSSGNPFEIAVASSELADILIERGEYPEARKLLDRALPVLRETVLPQQRDLKAAEALVLKLR